MANPLFNRFGPVFDQFGNSSQMPVQNPMQNFQNVPFQFFAGLVNRFNHFKSAFQGDAQQTVQELLSSGQMSQQRYEQFSNLATQLRGIFK